METENRKCSCGLKPIATIEENRKAWANDLCSVCYNISEVSKLKQIQALKEEIIYLRRVVDAARDVPINVPGNWVEALVVAFTRLDRWEMREAILQIRSL